MPSNKEQPLTSLKHAAAAAAVLGYWRHWPMLGWPASRLGMGNEPLGNLAAKPCVLACIWCISSCSICSHAHTPPQSLLADFAPTS